MIELQKQLIFETFAWSSNENSYPVMNQTSFLYNRIVLKRVIT